jgi:hypothetical protein
VRATECIQLHHRPYYKLSVFIIQSQRSHRTFHSTAALGMAPPKGARATVPQEATLEDTPTISKQKLAAQSQFAARGRRNGLNSTAMNGNGLKELAAASAAAQMNPQPITPPIGVRARSRVRSARDLVLTFYCALQIDWQKEDTKLLHRYRSAYHLSAPSAFQNPMANCILNSGIGPLSPTMARAKSKRRIRREELAMIVRRNFKEAPVMENECLVDLLYRVKVKGQLLIHMGPTFWM